MPEANDTQMQQYCDQRLRVRAEQLRSVVNSLRDDKGAIDDCYARAAGANPWADARTDGPPSLLDQNDLLTFNTVITSLIAVIDGSATTQQVADIASNWAAFQAACVRPVEG